MKLLQRMRLRTKLGLLMVLSVLAIIAAIGAAGSLVRQRMMTERIDKLAAVVDSAIGIAQGLQNREAAGQLTQDQAMALLRDDIHGMRYEKGEGYVTVHSDAGILMIHGANPKLEGKPSPGKDNDGRTFTEIVNAVLSNAESGVIHYAFNKPGENTAQEKISYVKHFAPWHLRFVAGAYTTDLNAAFRATILQLSLYSGAIIVVMLLVAFAINRDIVGSLGRLANAMKQLAAGDMATSVPGSDRGDEVGGMAQVVLVFKTHMQQGQKLEAEQAVNRIRNEHDKRAALVNMAEKIETETNEALHQVNSRTELMANAANEMQASAARTGQSAETSAAAAGQALDNARSVAGAAERLAASISEISGKVSHSTAVVARAVDAGTETRRTIEALNQQVGQIGAVADMIGEIAAKTNLLALNATIEAARAGEAGKGFAVVASEVKGLATQTAQSTQEIARHINEVRTATGAAVAAVGQIEGTIEEISTIAAWIATAVKQQGVATTQIAQNVSQTAAAADQMTARVHEVSVEALETGRRSTEVHDNAAALIDAMKDLKQAVVRVVRTATADVDRRISPRYQVDLGCTLTIRGRPPVSARVGNLSATGARITGMPSVAAGTKATLNLDGLTVALPCTIRSSNAEACGVQFELDAEAAHTLQAMLQRLPAQPDRRAAARQGQPTMSVTADQSDVPAVMARRAAGA